MSEKLLVGVDGGGSQTRAVICNAEGEVFGRGTSGSSNYYSVGLEETVANILLAIRQALADLNTPVLQSCGLGVSGCDCARRHHHAQNGLASGAGSLLR